MRDQFGERLSVLLSALEPQERTVWEGQVERAVHACGCTEGAAGLLLGALATIVATVAGAPGIGSSLPWRILFIIGGTLAGAAIGKIVGKARGRYRAHRLIAELAERVS